MSQPVQTRQPPSLPRTFGLLAVLVLLITALIHVMRGGGLPTLSTTASATSPTPALPRIAATPELQPALAQQGISVQSEQPLQPQIGTNQLDQQIWGLFTLKPVSNWPSMTNMWQPLPGEQDYIVAMVNANDQWIISVWRGPNYIPTGDSVGVHYWEIPAGTPYEEVLKARDALTDLLRQQGRLRQFRPEQQPQP
ncbi:MAG: hypothetical protein RI947_1496 [Candidatus Parcubacteria bacterium]|jgi:hypothetical protein